MSAQLVGVLVCTASAAAAGIALPQSLVFCNGTVVQHADWTGTDILPADKPLYTKTASECCAACVRSAGTAHC